VNINYTTENIFPVPIHIFNVNGFEKIQNDLIDYAYDLKNKEPKGVLFSNCGGWQSSCFLVNNENDILQSFLMDCLGEFPPIKKSVDLIVSAWLNINPPNSFNSMHSHPDCNLAGVLWIKTPKDCGNIVFQSPFDFQIYKEVESYTEEFKSQNKYFHKYNFIPIEGRIMVFPSHLEHQVKPNESKEDRISVSFNIRLK
tara:strand:- start:84 stop:677 length:594 start_codon:yes stop_codon:yes gene_type:complete